MTPTPPISPIFAFLPAPDVRLKVCVVIPARDESHSIEASLDAFLEQRDVQGAPLDPARFEILLLANNCRDQTAQVARDWSRKHTSIRLYVVEAQLGAADAGVGTARRYLMDTASARLLQLPSAQPQKPRAICSTDADTLVSPFWIAHTLEEMSAGAVAVGGRILLRRNDDCSDDCAARRTYLLDTAYHLLRARLEAMLDPRCGDPYPCHFQFFGASLAIRPETYRKIGGLPSVRCLEDVALGQRLESLDIAVRHSPHVMVSTSARRRGRVETGLSTQLDEWKSLEKSGTPWLVPSGDEIAFKAGLQRQLRAHWFSHSRDAAPQNSEETAELAALARRPALELCNQLKTATYFGALWQQFWNDVRQTPTFLTSFAPVPVEDALRQMRGKLEGIREK